MRFSFAAVVLILTLVAASMLNRQVAAQTQAKSRSLDQQLLDDLDRELLKGLPGAKLLPPKPSPSEKSATEASDKSENPLANLAGRMRAVQGRMARRDTSGATQEEQAKILSDLDALMEEAKKSRQAGDGQNRGGTSQAATGDGAIAVGPPRDSTNRIERGDVQPTEQVDAKDVLRRIWGHLPEKVREEMQASFSEQFLPKYERLIEEYYKRLAEERPTAP